jgi:TPR repeat protein
MNNQEQIAPNQDVQPNARIPLGRRIFLIVFATAAAVGIIFAYNSLGEQALAGGGERMKTIGADEMAELLRKSCDDGEHQACQNLAYQTYYGDGSTKDRAEASRLFKRACDGGYNKSCLELGIMTSNGFGITKDLAKSATLFKRACDAGVMEGCYNLGVQYKKGLGVAQDSVKGMELVTTACEGGFFHDACFAALEISDLESLMGQELGEETAKDLTEATIRAAASDGGKLDANAPETCKQAIACCEDVMAVDGLPESMCHILAQMISKLPNAAAQTSECNTTRQKFGTLQSKFGDAFPKSCLL